MHTNAKVIAHLYLAATIATFLGQDDLPKSWRAALIDVL